MATSTDAAETLADQAVQLETLNTLAQRFGQSLSDALSKSTASGKQLSGVLDDLANTLVTTLGKNVGSGIGTTLNSSIQSAVQSWSASSGLLGFGTEAFAFAKGGVLAGGTVMPFAQGGIVSAPTYFPMRAGVGLLGERGAEAVMPLARGPDGRLGVQGGGAAATHVTVNVAATDLDSFKRSEAQLSATFARAVARGRRAL